ncbi:MAG: hypothetical protein ACO1SV_13200 [Fimbriimonas sp.]
MFVEHNLNIYEKELKELLESRAAITLGMFSDRTSLLDAGTELGPSKLMPEFLRLALEDLALDPNSAEIRTVNFIFALIESSRDDSCQIESVSLLEHFGFFNVALAQRVFDSYRTVAFERSAPARTRAAALDAMLRCSMTSARIRHSLIGDLLGISLGDDPVFLAHAAKVVGTVHGLWAEEELIDLLVQLSKLEEARSDAAFELGLAKLATGLQCPTRAEAEACMSSARSWFKTSLGVHDERPDARLYVASLDLILEHFPKLDRKEALDTAELISRLAIELHSMHFHEDDSPWLTARNTQTILWVRLSVSIGYLVDQLEETTFWEPQSIVEDHLLAVYSASKSFFRKSEMSALELVTRPVIKDALVANLAHASSLKQWLRRNPGHVLEGEAAELSQAIDMWAKEVRSSPPVSAASRDFPVAAALVDANISQNAREAVLAALEETFRLQVSKVSVPESEILERCAAAVSQNPDYRLQGTGYRLFTSVLFLSIRFLADRLEMMRAHDETVSYLFEQDDGSLPHEKELQHDYRRFMTAAGIGPEVEVTDVGGGRADVRFTLHTERIVTEVKRDQQDTSFGALKDAYALQATDYQNVSVRLGFLLVLDQTELRTTGVPHITSLVQAEEVIRKGESDPRHLIIIKIPGRRVVPSGLTKAASIAKPNKARRRSTKP